MTTTSTAKIIPIHAAAPVADAGNQDFIDVAYERLSGVPGFVERPGQKELSRKIREAFQRNLPLLAEAPTGTGKTVAYLVGAVAALQELRHRRAGLRLVVATATKGLQGQIMTSDLKKLESVGLLEGLAVELAKGRGNYLCERQAGALASKDSTNQLDLLAEGPQEDVGDAAEALRLLRAFQDGDWNGDIDFWSEKRPRGWQAISAAGESCVGRKCDHYESCPFVKARARMGLAQVLVANHDMVLADLKMALDEDMDPMLGEQYLVVFDEAHHLPDKALETGRHEVKVKALADHLKKVPAALSAAWRDMHLGKGLDTAGVSVGDFSTDSLVAALGDMATGLDALEYDEQGIFRFAKGEVPPAVQERARWVGSRLEVLDELFQNASSALRFGKASKTQASMASVASAISLFASQHAPVRDAMKLFEALAAPQRMVRWAEKRKSGDVSLNTSPMEGAEVLGPLLWESQRVFPVMLSATLRDMGSFDRFIAKSGAPADDVMLHETPQVFDFSRCELVIARLNSTPKRDTREKWLAEVKEAMPQFIVQGTGNLVPFHSGEVMREVVPALRRKFGDAVKMQGTASLAVLIEAHKADVDAGRTSILCGLATMAEGLDLPGRWCENLIITQLPFAVPSDPVERELQDELGRDYFVKRALPDTYIKLVQLVGRLMRRESDRGRIVMLDKRLATEFYGKAMLNALPAYSRKRFEKPGDRTTV